MPWLARPDVPPADRLLSVADLAPVPLLDQGRGSGINRVVKTLFHGQPVPPVRSFGSNQLTAPGGFLAGWDVGCLPRPLFAVCMRDGRLIERPTTPTRPKPNTAWRCGKHGQHIGQIARVVRRAFDDYQRRANRL